MSGSSHTCGRAVGTVAGLGDEGRAGSDPDDLVG